jgi:hypothetical protein
METVELRLLALAGGLTVAAYRKFDGPTKKQVRGGKDLIDDSSRFLPSCGIQCASTFLLSLAQRTHTHTHTQLD